MRFAVISDIHGNMPALKAVLDDCKNQNIDKYLFMGDYYGEFPLQNEVIKSVMNTKDSYAIKGNKEARMVKLKNVNSSEWTSEQFAPLYWNLRNISNDNYEFINNLPEQLYFTQDNIDFYMAHSPSQHFGHGIVDNINGRIFLDEYGKYYTNHIEYISYVKDILQSNNDFINKISKIPDGIYLFGHYHTQWYANIGEKWFINPGSCGLPLDFDTSAPYTIIDTGNRLEVIERRIKYDTTKPVQMLKESDYYNVAPFWNELSIIEFENAKVTILLFLEFVEQLAIKKKCEDRPYSNELWRKAIAVAGDGRVCAYFT